MNAIPPTRIATSWRAPRALWHMTRYDANQAATASVVSQGEHHVEHGVWASIPNSGPIG
jgi:hypothetical protein